MRVRSRASGDGVHRTGGGASGMAGSCQSGGMLTPRCSPPSPCWRSSWPRRSRCRRPRTRSGPCPTSRARSSCPMPRSSRRSSPTSTAMVVASSSGSSAATATRRWPRCGSRRARAGDCSASRSRSCRRRGSGTRIDPVYQATPVRLLVRRVDGAERVTVASQPHFEEIDVGDPCCLLLHDLVIEPGGVARRVEVASEQRLRRCGPRHRPRRRRHG